MRFSTLGPIGNAARRILSQVFASSLSSSRTQARVWMVGVVMVGRLEAGEVGRILKCGSPCLRVAKSLTITSGVFAVDVTELDF